LTAFVYVVVFASLTGGIGFLISDGGNVPEPPPARADANESAVNSTPEPTPTSIEARRSRLLKKKSGMQTSTTELKNHDED
jgi:hypothetical protein